MVLSFYGLLLDLLVECVFLQHRVVLLQLDTLSSILPVLGSDVTAHAGLTGSLVLSALEDHLYSVFIPCHNQLAIAFCDYRVKIPFALDSFSTAEIPLKLIVLIAVVDNFSVIHLPSSGTKKRFV